MIVLESFTNKVKYISKQMSKKHITISSNHSNHSNHIHGRKNRASPDVSMKYTISKQLLVFAMAWMGTRDIYTALILTAVFTVLSDHLFNEESPYCVVPTKFRILSKLIDTNEDGSVSEEEINEAISILEKARREKEMKNQKHSFTLFHNYLQDSYNNVN
jgi:hypothetical protein